MKKVEVGINDLKTTHPQLVFEWNYEKNGALLPENVLSGSNKKVWWICPRKHEWEAVVSSRALNGSGCPYCSNQRLWEGYNDLKTWCISNQKIYLLEEWDYEKNEIQPTQVMPKTQKKVWWKCDKGHEWYACISNRTIKGYCCPICSGQEIKAGFNDLETTNPEIIYLWDYEKNIVKPNSVSRGSKEKIWWRCEVGHSWEASIHNIIQGKRCPICANKMIVPGINDLEKWCKDNNRLELLKEWDYNKNNTSPTEVSFGSQ